MSCARELDQPRPRSARSSMSTALVSGSSRSVGSLRCPPARTGRGRHRSKQGAYRNGARQRHGGEPDSHDQDRIDQTPHLEDAPAIGTCPRRLHRLVQRSPAAPRLQRAHAPRGSSTSTIGTRRLPGHPWHPTNQAYVELRAVQCCGSVERRQDERLV